MPVYALVLVSWFAVSLLVVALYALATELTVRRRRRRYRATGTRLAGGSLKPSASTGTKEPGTPTRATVTTVGCSSYSTLGAAWAVQPDLTLQRRENSSTVLGVYGYVTGALGASGAPPERAG